MNYGMRIATSGMLTSLYRQDVLTNNLANLDTVAFKPDVPFTRQRDPARIEDGLASLPSDTLLEQLGAGVLAAPTYTNFAQAPLRRTDAPLDLAIEGPGFFVLEPASTEPDAPVLLTRDGRLTRDARGRLVSVVSGRPVLDASNRPVTLRSAAPVAIDADGSVRQNNTVIAKLQLADVPDPQALERQGEGVFAAPPGTSLDQAAARVRQGYLEDSGVNEIEALMRVQAAARAVGSNAGLIAYHDRLMDRAINTLGRVA